MKRVISCVLLMLVLTSNAFALEVPTDTVVQNLNGSQQAIKTFTVSPEQDPAALIEEPFELEGYLYTFADIVKSENPVEEKRIHTEVITVETTKDDLALILEQLKPTIEYDDGRFQGTLALDHTSLNTVAAGYATKNYTVTETKTIGQLDRNDMSYVPATTIKNGRTLSLANVEWQVTGTDLVGEALMPSQYQAVATYSAKASYQAATGYVKVTISVTNNQFPLAPLFSPIYSTTRPYSQTRSNTQRDLLQPDEFLRLNKFLCIVMFNHYKPAQLYKIMLEELPEYKKLKKCSVFDYVPEWKKREEEGAKRRKAGNRTSAAPPAPQPSPVSGKRPDMQPQTSPTEEAAASGSSCGNDNMTPEEIGLVEMTCEAILEGDDPELEEMDDPTRIPPGRGI